MQSCDWGALDAEDKRLYYCDSVFFETSAAAGFPVNNDCKTSTGSQSLCKIHTRLLTLLAQGIAEAFRNLVLGSQSVAHTASDANA